MARLISGDDTKSLLDATTPVDFSGCLHAEQKKRFQDTMTAIHQLLVLYESIPELMEEMPIACTGAMTITLDHIRSMRFGSIPKVRLVYRKLEEATLGCGECYRERGGVVEKALRPVAKALMADSRPKRTGGDRSDPSRRFIAKDNIIADWEEGSTEELDLEDVGSSGDDWADSENRSEEGQADPEHGAPLESTLRPTECLATPQTIPHLHKSSIEAYSLRDPTSKVHIRKFNIGYDDYDKGPTVEDSLEIYRQLIVCLDNEKEDFKWSSMMLRFRDHGYRLLPSSLDQFYQSNPLPLDQAMHFFPTPPPHVIEEWKRTTSVEPTLEELLQLDKHTSLPYSYVAGADMVEMGIQDLLSQAGPEKSASSMKAFVMGKVAVGPEEDSYIRLNIMKDQVQLKEIDVTMDIDSVIWLTRRLKTKGAFNLHTSPYRKEAPPIYTANHTYIELLWPRLEEDIARGGISSGAQQVPLSHLPNTHFATFGRIEGAASVAVVFPRMMNRSPHEKHWSTKLPEEVELLWLRNVVYMALRRLEDRGIKPYVEFDYEDTKWKHAGAQETTLILEANHLQGLQDHMEKILQENEGDPYYDCFQSYFFVLEMKGIKTSTSSDDAAWKDPWELLVENHPSFDWEYMENTENGELLIDVGFGFHPSGDVPVVGLWKTDALRLGFDYGGYAQGTRHTVCTIPAVGGIGAEMAKARRLRMHISYRQSYNLAYEAIRGRLTRERKGFFSAHLAYHQKESYQWMVKGVTDAFLRSCKKSYGVRDEYRCRATVRGILPALAAKVRTCQVMWFR